MGHNPTIWEPLPWRTHLQLSLKQHGGAGGWGSGRLGVGELGLSTVQAGCFRRSGARSTWKEQYRDSCIGQHPRSVDKQKTRAFSACNLLPFKSFPAQPERGRKGALIRRKKETSSAQHASSTQTGCGGGFLPPAGCLLRARHPAEGPKQRDK